MQPTTATSLVNPIPNLAPATELPSFDGHDTQGEQEKMERIERYSSPVFTLQLLEHMRAAVSAAIFESQELREK